MMFIVDGDLLMYNFELSNSKNIQNYLYQRDMFVGNKVFYKTIMVTRKKFSLKLIWKFKHFPQMTTISDTCMPGRDDSRALNKVQSGSCSFTTSFNLEFRRLFSNRCQRTEHVDFNEGSKNKIPLLLLSWCGLLC